MADLQCFGVGEGIEMSDPEPNLHPQTAIPPSCPWRDEEQSPGWSPPSDLGLLGTHPSAGPSAVHPQGMVFPAVRPPASLGFGFHFLNCRGVIQNPYFLGPES